MESPQNRIGSWKNYFLLNGRDGYEKTPPFELQEKMRTLSVTLRELANHTVKDAAKFNVNGWQQYLATHYVLGQAKQADQVPGSQCAEFCRYAEEQLKKAERAFASPEFHKVNIRSEIKRIFMWPHENFYPWQTLEAPVVKRSISDIFQTIPTKLALTEGKLYLNFPGSLRDTFGEKKVFARLREAGFPQVQANHEVPHLTLLGSAQVGKIRDELVKVHGPEEADDRLQALFAKLVVPYNEKYGQGKEAPLAPERVAWIFSEDYPLFQGCVFLVLKSLELSKCLQSMYQQIQEKTGVDMGSAPRCDKGYHLTVARQPRVAVELPDGISSVTEMVDKAGIAPKQAKMFKELEKAHPTIAF